MTTPPASSAPARPVAVEPAPGGAGPDRAGPDRALAGGALLREHAAVALLPPAPRPWGPRATWAVRAMGIGAVAAIAVTVWLGLWVTPPSEVMGNLVRLVYVHPPIAWVAMYLAFGALGLGSILWLWPRTRSLVWDRLAVAGAEVGVAFTALTLVTGSIWGRPTWGVWWAWDARLTSTALLLVLLLGYLALRRVPSDSDTRARRAAVAGLVALVDVPIVYFSVSWWHTLHQTSQVDIHGLMAATMLLGFVGFTLAFGWMLATSLRIQALKAWLEDAELQRSLADRRAEGHVGRPPAAQVPAGEVPGPLAVGAMTTDARVADARVADAAARRP